MLAQQEGATVYDQRSRQPIVATFAVFVLLAMILGTFPTVGGLSEADNTTAMNAESATESSPTEVSALPEPSSDAEIAANPLSQIPADAPLGRMHALGRSLFGDYLFAVELAGTLLLVATIGAIAIAPRRRRGTL
jgi:NADH-quinone oxidoreductase subunit J